MLFGLCSLKSSPGVTTTALALASCWPIGAPTPVVIELDARGGDMAWRFGLHEDPGLRSLAAAARLRPDPMLLAGHARPVGPASVQVVTAPLDSGAARQAAAALTPLLDVLREAPYQALLDLGRIDPKDPEIADLLGDLAGLLVVARPVPEQVARVNAAARELHGAYSGVRVLFIGDITDAEVADQCPLPVAGVLPLINPDGGPLNDLARIRVRKKYNATATRLAYELVLGQASAAGTPRSSKTVEVAR